jgi:hypothetical protein
MAPQGQENPHFLPEAVAFPSHRFGGRKRREHGIQRCNLLHVAIELLGEPPTQAVQIARKKNHKLKKLRAEPTLDC